MKLYVIVVVGLILALAPLACSDDSNTSVSNTPTVTPVVSDTHTIAPSISNFPSKEVNQNLGNIINLVQEMFDSNPTSNEDSQMEISKSFDQLI